MTKNIKSIIKKILISNNLLKLLYQNYYNRKLKKRIQKKNELFKENGLLTFKELGKILSFLAENLKLYYIEQKKEEIYAAKDNYKNIQACI